MANYTTIKLPDNLVREIDQLVGTHGFTSRTEVVKEALRDFFRKYPETAQTTTELEAKGYACNSKHAA